MPTRQRQHCLAYDSRPDVILFRMDTKDDTLPDDPHSDWSEPDTYSADYVRWYKTPEPGTYSEDLRLQRLGLDSDKLTSLDILIELKRRMAQYKKEKEHSK